MCKIFENNTIMKMLKHPIFTKIQYIKIIEKENKLRMFYPLTVHPLSRRF